MNRRGGEYPPVFDWAHAEVWRMTGWVKVSQEGSWAALHWAAPHWVYRNVEVSKEKRIILRHFKGGTTVPEWNYRAVDEAGVQMGARLGLEGDRWNEHAAELILKEAAQKENELERSGSPRSENIVRSGNLEAWEFPFCRQAGMRTHRYSIY